MTMFTRLLAAGGEQATRCHGVNYHRVYGGCIYRGSVYIAGTAVWAVFAWACSSPKPAEYPSGRSATEEQPDPSWETGDAPVADDEPAEETPAASGQKKPVFTDGMGVEEAISAVPSDYEYIGLDQEVLAKPLTQLETYKECKVKPSDKFKVRIAVWDGKVVGANVTSTNKALAQCIDGVVRQLEYKDKVESINTVEYSF